MGKEMKKPANDYEALLLILELGITAPTDKKSDECIELADSLCQQMNDIEIARAKREVKIKLNL